MTAPPPEAGFSLVETLVALAVIAGMSAMLFEAVSTHALAAERTVRKREAILLARSLLDRASVAPGPEELAADGRWRDLSWHITRRAAAGGARNGGAGLQQVRIDVLESGSRRRLVRVETLRLAR